MYAQKLTYRLRNEVAQKINHLPMKYFDKKTNGEVLSIITNDIDTLVTKHEPKYYINNYSSMYTYRYIYYDANNKLVI